MPGMGNPALLHDAMCTEVPGVHTDCTGQMNPGWKLDRKGPRALSSPHHSCLGPPESLGTAKAVCIEQKGESLSLKCSKGKHMAVAQEEPSRVSAGSTVLCSGGSQLPQTALLLNCFAFFTDRVAGASL